MKGTSLIVLAAGLLLSSTQALQLVRRDANPAVIGLDIQRRNVDLPVERDLQRRAGTVSEILTNEETLYFANVSIGTPPQNFRLQIDTGSSDLWTEAGSSKLCQSRSRTCDQTGTCMLFNFLILGGGQREFFVNVQVRSSNFNISYDDGSGASGDYVTDTLQIGGQSLKNFQFGVGYSSTASQGVLGIGYPLNEAQVNQNGGQPYPNLPQAMANDGLIQTPFSLWLNDLASSTGSILFGGVNTDKFHGSLQTLPIQPTGQDSSGNYVYTEFIIALTDVSLTQGGTTTNMSSDQLPAPALLDSGTTLTYLPNNITQAIFNAVGAQYDSSQGTAFAPCSLANTNATLDFTFSKPTISVPMNELILGSSGQATLSNGESACVFGIAPAQGSTPILGDTFIRSAYIVYDVASNQISIAQTNFNSTQDNILEIGNSIPDATTVSNPVTTINISGGSAGVAATLGSSTIKRVPSPTASSGATPTQIPLGMAAGVAGAGLLLAAL